MEGNQGEKKDGKNNRVIEGGRKYNGEGGPIGAAL